MAEWVAANSASFAPRLGHAVHRIALAWARRSTRWVSETTEEQFAGMETHLHAAVEDARAVVAARVRELKDAAVEGHRLYTAGDGRRALARLTRAIELTGGNAEVYYWRGRTYLKLNDNESALSDFEAAIRLDVKHVESYRNIDYLLVLRRDRAGIIAHWDRYIEAEPGDARGYLERGGARHHMWD
jgi:Flp pilus assembly protein TadD